MGALGGIYETPEKVTTFLITIFFLTSVLEFVVPCCVLLNDVLNVSVGTFS